MVWLASSTNNERADADLVLAADVLCYMGDLKSLFKRARKALKGGGLFVFSVEELVGAGAGAGAGMEEQAAGGGAGAEDDASGSSAETSAVADSSTQSSAEAPPSPLPPFALQASGRFKHSPDYLGLLADTVGLEVVEMKRCAARVDGELAVPSLVVVMRAIGGIAEVPAPPASAPLVIT
jgi:predicted TPR repeat methyltransferase